MKQVTITVPGTPDGAWSMTIKTRYPDNESNRGSTDEWTPIVFSSTKELVEFCVLELIRAGDYKR